MSVPFKFMIGRNFSPEDNLLIGQPAYDNFDAIVHKFGIGDGGITPRWFPGVDKDGNSYMQRNALVKSENPSFGNHGYGFEGDYFVIRINGRTVFRANTLGAEVDGLLKTSADTTQFIPSDTGLAELIAPLFNNKSLLAQFNRPAFAGVSGPEKKFLVSRDIYGFLQSTTSIFYRGGTADNGSVFKVDKYGKYVPSSQDEPRIQHDIRTKKCLGLLIEPSSRNLLVQSMNPLLWGTVTDIEGTREIVTNWTNKGLSNPFTFSEAATTNEHSIRQVITANITQTLTGSFYYQSRAFTGNRKLTVFFSDEARNNYFGIDIQATAGGTPTFFGNRILGGGSVNSVNITNVGDGIYRIDFSGVINASGTNAQGNVVFNFASLADSSSGSLVYTPGSRTPWCYVNDFQVEQRSTVTSYIRTVSVSLLRNADVLKLNLKDNFNYTNLEGLFEIAMRINNDNIVNTTIFSLQDDTASNRLDFYIVSLDASTKTCVIGFKRIANNSVVETNNNFATTSTVKAKINYSYENISTAYTQAVFSGETGIGAIISSISYE